MFLRRLRLMRYSRRLRQIWRDPVARYCGQVLAILFAFALMLVALASIAAYGTFGN